MIWYNIKELEKHLINGEVSDKHAFTYLLTHLIILTGAMHFSSDFDPIWAEWGHFIISLGATIWGLSKTFEINRAGDNRDYLKRFLSLSFVAGIRMFGVVFIISFLLVVVAMVGEISFFLSSFQEAVLELGLFTIFVALYYYVLITSFKKVSSGERSPSQMGAA